MDEFETLGQQWGECARKVMTEAESEFEGLMTEARVDLSDWESQAREGFRTLRIRLADLLEDAPVSPDPAPAGSDPGKE